MTSVADPTPTARAGSDREDLLRYARGTWKSFEAMADPDGLPSDRLQPDDRGAWVRSKTTSPTDIGAYLWSTLAARSLGLVDDLEADRRLTATLSALERMDRLHGFYFNLYDVATATRPVAEPGQVHPPRAFLSSVDNAWLAVALTMIRNVRPALRDRLDALLGPMDFGFFYVPFDPANPADRPGQFSGGYNADDGTFATPYGMLNAETRIISYLAIARAQAPSEQYYRLFRTLPPARGPQTQEPRGVVRTYLGVPVFEGHYEYGGTDLVPSWGGSMFEALMVPLFVPEETWAPRSWGVNHPLYVRAQVDQGMNVRKYGYWGFSPSWTPEGGYQTYGVGEIGTQVDGYKTYEIPANVPPKQGKTTGPCPEGVVTPHAVFLALRYAPREALENLRNLAAAFPIFEPELGFRDSVNVTTGTVARCVLSLDQGMVMAAIANALADDAMRAAFCQGPVEAAIRPLIAPEAFTAGVRRP